MEKCKLRTFKDPYEPWLCHRGLDLEKLLNYMILIDIYLRAK